MFYFIVIAILSSYLCCCDSRDHFIVLSKDTNIEKTGKAFIRDIPMGTRGYKPGYIYTQMLTSKSQMNIIENGFDSLCIRLWYGYSFDSRIQCLTITKTGFKWEAEYNLLTTFLDDKDSILSIEKSTEKKFPKSGWHTFIKKLLDQNVTTLPDDWLIPGSASTPTHGDVVSVEIATRNNYRYYSYYSPGWYRGVKEAQAMQEILRLVEYEFSFKKIREF